MRLSPAQQQILIALQQGGQLKVHRTADGGKIYRLHLATAPSDAMPASIVLGVEVTRLETAGLLASNMKFPAATFLLTDEGVRAAAELTGETITPTGPRNYR